MTDKELKAAEMGILTYLTIIRGEEPEYIDSTLIFKSSFNVQALKATMRACVAMDMDTAEVKFK